MELPGGGTVTLGPGSSSSSRSWRPGSAGRPGCKQPRRCDAWRSHGATSRPSWKRSLTSPWRCFRSSRTYRPPRDPRLTPVETFDVGIVGAGVHGASAAFHLAPRLNVVIFERLTPAGGPTVGQRRVSRLLHEHLLATAARQHRDDGTVQETHRRRRRLPQDGDVVPASARRCERRRGVGGAVEPVGDRHLVVRPGTLHPRVPVVQPRRDQGRRARARRRLCRPIRDHRRALPTSDRVGSGREDGCSGGRSSRPRNEGWS